MRCTFTVLRSLQSFPLFWRRSQLLPRKRYVFFVSYNALSWKCVLTDFAFILCFVKCFQLASKKGGLGAQKVSSKSFSELEKKAQAADKLREKEDGTATAKKNIQHQESMCVCLLLSLMIFYPFLWSVNVFLCFYFWCHFSKLLPSSSSALRPCDWPVKILSSRGKLRSRSWRD